MLEFLKQYWVQICSASGFILSLINAIHTLVTQHRSITLDITEMKSYNDLTFFYFVITNKSRLPIAITDVKLLINNTAYRCTHYSHFLWNCAYKIGKEVIDKQDYRSLALPIQIGSLAAEGGYLLFEVPQSAAQELTTQANFVILTNRGAPIQTTLELPQGNRLP